MIDFDQLVKNYNRIPEKRLLIRDFDVKIKYFLIPEE